MKKPMLLLTAFLLVSCVLQAAPCVSGTLASYIAGPACTVDGLLFSNFGYTSISSGGGVSPDATGVAVKPTMMGGEFGLSFIASWLAASNQTSDGNITYTVSCPGCLINDALLTMDGVGTGTGVASVAETSTSTTPNLGLGTSDSVGFIKLTDSATFAPVGTLDLNKDIGASGGTAGVGHVSSVANLFSTSTVPEPSLLFLCAGMLGVIPIARRKWARRRL